MDSLYQHELAKALTVIMEASMSINYPKLIPGTQTLNPEIIFLRVFCDFKTKFT
jgi:hypothetical protein